MEKRTVMVKDPNGLHLRSAARIVKSCRKFNCRVSLSCAGCPVADACSIIQILLLQAGKGAEVTITAEGPDEIAAAKEIELIFAQGEGI